MSITDLQVKNILRHRLSESESTEESEQTYWYLVRWMDEELEEINELDTWEHQTYFTGERKKHIKGLKVQSTLEYLLLVFFYPKQKVYRNIVCLSPNVIAN